MGMVTPLGRDVEETFTRAAAGESGVRAITSFDTSGLPCRIAGQVDDAWLEDGATDRMHGLASRGLRLMLSAGRQAATAARLHEVASRQRVGVALGSHGDYPSLDQILLLHRHTDGKGRWNLPGLARTAGYDSRQLFRRKPDVTAGLLAATFGCHGPNLSLVSACAAGAQAIGEAYRLILDGGADVMLGGGCEATVNFMGLLGFTLLHALAEEAPAPETASRPFDRRRNGFVLSEGAGAVVLEAEDHALARGATVLGEVLGYGDSADAYRITDAHPLGTGAALAMQSAIREAGLSPDEVDVINAHATSTVQGDIAEARAIAEVFGDRSRTIPVTANKSMLGHTIAAAGAIECILTLVGMHNALILPTINYRTPDPRCPLDVVGGAARVKEHRVALSNSFGFGGQNACLCLGRGDD